MLTMQKLLEFLVANGGSDLHLSADAVPRIRINGELKPLSMPALNREKAAQLIHSIISEEQIKTLEKTRELDASYELDSKSRFRVNVYYQRGRIRTTIRHIPTHIKTFKDLHLPVQVFEKICSLNKGLILVTGATGSGKSTTLAAMIDFINSNFENHIVTIEDPIEFVHQDKMCMLSQREIGGDSHTFAAALKHVLRQDPDVVLIGEMRDAETVQVGLELSETGHLTLATLHTSDAVQTVNRIIDIFPPEQHSQVRTQLAFVLEAIVCQQLVKRRDGAGRVAALEILLATQGVRANIRGDKIHQLYSTIQTSSNIGMRTMNQSLLGMVRDNVIDEATAIANAMNQDELMKLLEHMHETPEEYGPRGNTKTLEKDTEYFRRFDNRTTDSRPRPPGSVR